jgi:chromosomal replication initiator protein
MQPKSGSQAGRSTHQRSVNFVPPFLAGEENRFAQTAVRAIWLTADRVNPLCFVGRPGVGKTHLVRAIGDQWQATRPKNPLTMFDASLLGRGDAIERLLRTLRSSGKKTRCGMLIVDDLHKLPRGDARQMELAALFDEAAKASYHVVVTSTIVPGEMSQLSPRLKSRLTAGLCVELSPPTLHVRREIVRLAAMLRGVDLPISAVRRIADDESASPKTLLADLDEIVQFAGQRNTVVNTQLVNEFYARRAPPKRPSVTTIVSAVARYFRFKVKDLSGPGRQQTLVRVRSVAMLLARRLSNESYANIGRQLGGRDHSTVMHACRNIDELLKTDPQIRIAVRELEETLRNAS